MEKGKKVRRFLVVATFPLEVAARPSLCAVAFEESDEPEEEPL